MTKEVDSYRFISRSTKRIMQAWAKREPLREIPWSALSKPMEACTIALTSSAAIALNQDKFDPSAAGPSDCCKEKSKLRAFPPSAYLPYRK